MAPSFDERMPEPAERKYSLPKRTKSTSSERSTPSASPNLSGPGPVALEPAYVAAASASDIVTSDFYAYYDEEEAEIADEPEVIVSPGSLKLVNAFLDHLLWQILAASRSTSLANLRAAVTEVLKPRLARDAIGGADRELRAYVGSGDDEELLDNADTDSVTEFDLEHTWRRARQRCMVYSSLGDLEEEDDGEHDDLDGQKRPGSSSGSVPAATAIFLTSILEFLGETTLHAAGDAARQRLLAKLHDLDRASSTSSTVDEPLVVEESDTEKVALNVSLGRLWRTWRKKLRTPNGSMSRPMSRESFSRRFGRGSIASRHSSMDNNDSIQITGNASRKISIAEVPEEVLACSIPLPTSDNDVEEIEIGDWTELPADTVPQPVLKRVRSVILAPNDWLYGTPGDGDITPTATRTIAPPLPLSSRLVRSKSFIHSKSKALIFPEVRPEEVPLPVFDANDYPGEVCDEFEQKPVAAAAAAAVDEPIAEPVPVKETIEEPAEELATAPIEEPTKTLVEAPAEKLVKAPAEELIEKPSNEKVTEETEAGRERRSSVSKSVVAAIAGAGAAGVAVVAGVAAAISGRTAETDEDELQVSSKPVFEHHELDDEPVIEEASRMSIEGSRTPPELVETRSRSSSLKSHRSQPSTEQDLRRKISFKKTKPSIDLDDPNAIGLARTSDVSIALPSPRSPHFDVPVSPVLGAEMSEQEKRELRNAHRNQFVLSQSPPLPPPPAQAAPTLVPPPNTLSAQQNSYQKHRPSPLGDSNMLMAPQAYERGVPPLTPLREMMEAAVDTSDEASVSSTRSDHEDEAPPPPPKNHVTKTSSSSTSSDEHSVYSDDSRKALPFAPSERAGVQRVYTPPATPGTEVIPKARRSESFGRDKRPNTSASNNSNSSVKKRGLMSWGEAKTSEDSSSISVSEKHSQMVAKNNDKARNFEKLLENDETLQLTLTPQTVREPPGPESPRFAPAARVNATNSQPDSPRFGTISRSQTPRNDDFSKQKSSPSIDSSGPIQKTVVTVTRLNGLRSNPPPSPRVTVSSPTILSPPPAKKYIPKSQPPPPSKGNRSGLEARDARPNRSSMRDIAEFIRRTGPGERFSFDRSRPNTAKQQQQHKRLSTPVTGSMSMSAPLATAKDQDMNREPRKFPMKKLEARDATINKRNSSSDLIDFIRSGPPGEKPVPRVPRNSAPVRNTMSSDQSYDLKDNRSSALDKPQSYHSSYSSATGLLSQTAKMESKMDNNGMPQRKQRRVADPYAIDSDDDDDDFLMTPRGFEADDTLAHFLTSPTPREDSKPASVTSKTAGPRTRVPTSAPQLSLSGQSPILSDSSFTSSGTSTYQPSRGGSNSGRAGTGTYQPRSGRVERHSSSNDLAEFLRNSGPPETTQTYVPPPQSDSSSIARMFSRTGSKNKRNNYDGGFQGHSVVLS